ncbi:MAG: DUF1080 domain-containing protein [Candidatus Solibacter usitatus]|nr:DUF1080 domain-containing protein [Candidatus Solibacter usitatus]
MSRIALALLMLPALMTPATAQPKASPFAGRWNFNIVSPGGVRASWLGITEKDGKLDVWYQPASGNVFQLKDVKVDGQRLVLTLNQAAANRPATTWELEAAGGKLTGSQRRGENSIALEGVRAPLLNRPAPKQWTKPEPLLNGKNLDGWEPIGDPTKSRWVIKDGLLVNEDHGANLKSIRKFDDFKLHFEVNCPDHANSGMYLRGRYEIQLEYDPTSTSPPERRMGSIYGRIAPKQELPSMAGQWETFDVTLVGRTLTLVRNGATIIDRQEIEGITGGALDANEGEPGAFYIQGDHTGGLKFRNITISVPRR